MSIRDKARQEAAQGVETPDAHDIVGWNEVRNARLEQADHEPHRCQHAPRRWAWLHPYRLPVSRAGHPDQYRHVQRHGRLLARADLGAASALVTALLAGAASALSITAKGIPEDYQA